MRVRSLDFGFLFLYGFGFRGFCAQIQLDPPTQSGRLCYDVELCFGVWFSALRVLGAGCRVLGFTHSIHGSSMFGLPYRALNLKMVKPQKGSTMQTVGRV